ncbi:unnamed protein product [Rotaria sp. Silwood2]|nr:unnamed protein product [Rotaria sp. Silwood2]CAF3145072.1 unnamed protein product [Rotaria sp. Silwood2]CAF3412056.1 unnamed protein product [Rotaria sp. Silwood2]CAF4262293.1 unnamed protein product [Rotaria sp. Silwood2]CAF4321402.1 unnamed protein product [Rotaria sp. Silwood2]
MSQLINCDLHKFFDALQPLIVMYNIEQNERLNLAINQCYKRLVETDANDDKSIQNLIGNLIQVITEDKVSNKNYTAIVSICEKIDLSECFNFAYDLSQLFISYYVTPLLEELNDYKTDFSSWRLFNEQLTIMKRRIKNAEINSIVLKDFVAPLQKELDKYNIDILRLHDMIHNRYLLNHVDICTIEEQQDFIDQLDEYKFSTKFIYCDLATTMVNLLKQASLKQYEN